MLRTGKHQALVDDPVIRYKSVESLPGIGPVFGRRLRDAGFATADKILSKYLTLNRNENRFTSWLCLVSGANSRFAAQCFSGLDEWYRIWGKEAHIPQMKKASSTLAIQNSLTNRMLLEQKMLQFNINSSDDRLRKLNQCQTYSLFDISRSQGTLPEMLNKSQPNISNALRYDYEPKIKKNGKCHSLASLINPIQKSVNFKENEIIEIGKPRKFKIPTSPKRTISPILKSRSITPENRMSANLNNKNVIETLNISCESTKTNLKKLNNLNSNFNTYTKRVPIKSEEPRIKRDLSMTNEKNIKNKSSNSKAILKNPSSKGRETYQNIEKYSDEVKNTIKSPKMSKPEVDGIQDSLFSVSTKSGDFRNDAATEKLVFTNETEDKYIGASDNLNQRESNGDLPRQISPIPQRQDEQEENKTNSQKRESEHYYEDSVTIDLNTNTQMEFPNKSNGSDDDFSFGTSIDFSSTENNEPLSKVLSPLLNNHQSDIPDSSDLVETNRECNLHGKESETCVSFSESNFDNSNEDSGLDVNINGLIEFPNESDSSDDESLTPFENVDSLSGGSTDRTFEVNETTDAESAFNFIATSTTTSNAEGPKNDGKDDGNNFDSTYDDAKKTNVRLFCDMLSSDLEQLPMDKFRQLKLKILKLVYAELDECG